ncbi:4Fe-4S binding protein [Alkalibaculum bacchi]|jgi:Fe-S-cluster-containing hydrogenase component 2|uniref:4Fe-4S binding protein n=1 Tax=Alkalibaculum bacchi TaxID=645887 RepID=UPI0026EC3D79|nr:4Fe-4S binding protein [Alkalibaculum bacchi]
MEAVKKKVKRNAVVSNECVACGVCMQVCPFGSINVYKGIRAVVNLEKCVGCGKCAKSCPASVIKIHKEEN